MRDEPRRLHSGGARAMKLGVVAAEFPPKLGGMQEHAAGIVRHLPSDFDVTVLARPGATLEGTRAHIIDRLSCGLEHDRALCAGMDVDAWLILSAGMGALAATLGRPSFVYVHGNDFITPWRPALPPMIARMKKTPLLHRFSDRAARRWRLPKVHAGLQAAVRIFSNSRYTRDRCIAQFGLPPSKFEVMPPGIDDRHFTDVERRAEPHLRILTVARLDPANRRKNVEGLLRAVAATPELPTQTIIVGDGKDRPRLEALATELGVQDRVRFAGSVSAEGLRACYCEADVLVMPVREAPNDVEGYGMVFVEAAATGLPSIATACGGITDAIVDGETGILLPSGEPYAIGAGLRRFAAERELFDPQRIRAFAAERTASVITAGMARSIRAVLPTSVGEVGAGTTQTGFVAAASFRT